jgi:arylsulfatase A-like enzyme
LISGKVKGWRDYVVTEFGGVNHLGMTQRTIRRGNLKYGYNCCCEDELYDLASDPYETQNLIHHPKYRDAADDFRRLLADWMQQTGDTALRFYRWSMGYH